MKEQGTSAGEMKEQGHMFIRKEVRSSSLDNDDLIITHPVKHPINGHATTDGNRGRVSQISGRSLLSESPAEAATFLLKFGILRIQGPILRIQGPIIHVGKGKFPC
jgi:hypothetical protein